MSTSLLEDLFTKYGTDKGFWGYTPHYVAALEARRHEIKRVMEVGICGHRDIPNNVIGASLWAWHDFFPNAEIVGLDNDPRWMVNTPDGRIRSFCVDAFDTQALLAVMTQLGGAPFDFVVDDAANHEPEEEIHLLRDLLPFLANDGLYSIEDVRPYRLPDSQMSHMLARFPDGLTTQIHKTFKSEVLLLVQRSPR